MANVLSGCIYTVFKPPHTAKGAFEKKAISSTMPPRTLRFDNPVHAELFERFGGRSVLELPCREFSKWRKSNPLVTPMVRMPNGIVKDCSHELRQVRRRITACKASAISRKRRIAEIDTLNNQLQKLKKVVECQQGVIESQQDEIKTAQLEIKALRKRAPPGVKGTVAELLSRMKTLEKRMDVTDVRFYNAESHTNYAPLVGSFTDLSV